VRTRAGRWLLVSLLAAWSLTAQAGSFTISPLRLELSPAAPVAVLEIGNTGTEPVTVQAQARSWNQSNGNDEYGEARPFILNPSIFTVAPNSRQTVRVALRGAPPKDKEAAYRLTVTEIPAPQSAGSGIRVALRMDLPVFVAPQSGPAQPAPQFALDRRSAHTRVVVMNAGNGHLRLADVKISDGKQTIELPVLVVLAGATRFIELPKGAGPPWRLEADSNAGPIEADLRDAP
jgi:fimbrial chaperone protein